MRFFSKIKSSKFMIGYNIRQNSASKCTVSVKCICKICGKSKQHEMGGCLTNAADFAPFSARALFHFWPTTFIYFMLLFYYVGLAIKRSHIPVFFSYLKLSTYIDSSQYVDHFSYQNAENTSMSKVQIYCYIPQQQIFVRFKALLLN